ncbi:hypothetical protein LWC34_01980 [Kibdelosporangium philippinense]|uniref:Uncharacterized protein n=1 Tax=Kibdelosporangium philippinense TaxID=211113 RepID=A0ABS8Z4B0_9PSEU|nr:hypothetical protein [Kibdelosporangium philippinense]MCE7001615.1 hypothetical protein [Kibdelosporangium philippinense]
MTLLLRSWWTGDVVFLVLLLLVPAICARVPFYTMSVAVLTGALARKA